MQEKINTIRAKGAQMQGNAKILGQSNQQTSLVKVWMWQDGPDKTIVIQF